MVTTCHINPIHSFWSDGNTFRGAYSRERSRPKPGHRENMVSWDHPFDEPTVEDGQISVIKMLDVDPVPWDGPDICDILAYPGIELW